MIPSFKNQFLWQNKFKKIKNMQIENMNVAGFSDCDLALQRQLTQSNLLFSILHRIRGSLDLSEVLRVTVAEVREFLQVDRVVVFQVFDDGTSRGTAESVGERWMSILEDVFPPEAFPPSCYESYVQGKITLIRDRAEYNVVPCMQQLMDDYQIKSKLAVPILSGDRLWGLLLAHQCSHKRDWQDWEVLFVKQLARQLEVPIEQAELYQRLQSELEQRKKAEDELRSLTERLERSNKELEGFAYVSSHDLQEPLRKIQAFGDRLQSRCGDTLDDKSKDYLQRMLNASNRAQNLVDSLLSFARISSKAKPFTRVNLQTLLEDVLSNLEVRIERAGGKVELGQFPEIDADELQIYQLFQNLIGNSLKFKREDVPPVVTIRSQIEGDRVRIEVADNGIGFDEKYSDRIFGVFQRLHGRTEYEGSGIGLSICLKIIERHGGTIKPHSQIDQGTTFVISLPIKQVNPEA